MIDYDIKFDQVELILIKLLISKQLELPYDPNNSSSIELRVTYERLHDKLKDVR